MELSIVNIGDLLARQGGDPPIIELKNYYLVRLDNQERRKYILCESTSSPVPPQPTIQLPSVPLQQPTIHLRPKPPQQPTIQIFPTPRKQATIQILPAPPLHQQSPLQTPPSNLNANCTVPDILKEPKNKTDTLKNNISASGQQKPFLFVNKTNLQLFKEAHEAIITKCKKDLQAARNFQRNQLAAYESLMKKQQSKHSNEVLLLKRENEQVNYRLKKVANFLKQINKDFEPRLVGGKRKFGVSVASGVESVREEDHGRSHPSASIQLEEDHEITKLKKNLNSLDVFVRKTQEEILQNVKLKAGSNTRKSNSTQQQIGVQKGQRALKRRLPKGKKLITCDDCDQHFPSREFLREHFSKAHVKW